MDEFRTSDDEEKDVESNADHFFRFSFAHEVGLNSGDEMMGRILGSNIGAELEELIRSLDPGDESWAMIDFTCDEGGMTVEFAYPDEFTDCTCGENEACDWCGGK